MEFSFLLKNICYVTVIFSIFHYSLPAISLCFSFVKLSSKLACKKNETLFKNEIVIYM